MWGYGLRDTPTTGWVGLDVGIRAVFSKHDDLTFVCTGDGVWCGFAQLEAPKLQLRSGFLPLKEDPVAATAPPVRFLLMESLVVLSLPNFEKHLLNGLPPASQPGKL